MARKPAISSNKKSTKSTKAKKAISSTKKISTSKQKDNIVSKISAPFSFVYKKIRSMPIISEVIAEFIGTFLLVAMIFSIQVQPLYIAFVVIGIVLMFGRISGAFINPALVAGAWITRKIKSLKAICYILAEVFGALAAWLLVNAVATESYKAYSIAIEDYLLHAGTVNSGSEWLVFFSELIGGLILGLGFAVALKSKKLSIKSACTYGLTILIALIFTGWATSALLTSGSYTTLSIINPAIAVVTKALAWQVWPIAIFVIAPIIGSTLGFGIMEIVNANDKDDECDCVYAK